MPRPFTASTARKIDLPFAFPPFRSADAPRLRGLRRRAKRAVAQSQINHDLYPPIFDLHHAAIPPLPPPTLDRMIGQRNFATATFAELGVGDKLGA